MWRLSGGHGETSRGCVRLTEGWPRLSGVCGGLHGGFVKVI